MSMSVRSLIDQLDASKLKAEREMREAHEAAQRHLEEQQALEAEERQAREAEERQAALEEQRREREKWKVDEEESAREVAEMKKLMMARLEKPKKKQIVRIKEIPALVLDIGSCTIKAGRAGEDAPAVVMSALVGFIADPESMDLEKHAHVKKDMYFGDEVWAYHDVLTIQRIIHRGVVQNFELFEKLLRYLLFEELGLSQQDIEEQPILVSEPPLSPKVGLMRLHVRVFVFLCFFFSLSLFLPVFPFWALSYTFWPT
eukprot:m.116192 g.116192  ORF g.116192 m.116192 type:complete len:258 (-) comp13600_c0_seq3:1290-2063(-)